MGTARYYGRCRQECGSHTHARAHTSYQRPRGNCQLGASTPLRVSSTVSADIRFPMSPLSEPVLFYSKDAVCYVVYGASLDPRPRSRRLSHYLTHICTAAAHKFLFPRSIPRPRSPFHTSQFALTLPGIWFQKRSKYLTKAIEINSLCAEKVILEGKVSHRVAVSPIQLPRQTTDTKKGRVHCVVRLTYATSIHPYRDWGGSGPRTQEPPDCEQAVYLCLGPLAPKQVQCKHDPHLA
ncbi:hypothetical protein J6590_012541 [Homalodisca vitripennis]|nr:hypothetical protein J6590_012541 [Homalodisca vitripennis]